MKKGSYYVYILANKKHGTLYIGTTNNLVRRIYEHKNNLVDGFTKKYSIHNLVYWEEFTDPDSAILKEKQIKKWQRAWKARIIEKNNPKWLDLYNDII